MAHAFRKEGIEAEAFTNASKHTLPRGSDSRSLLGQKKGQAPEGSVSKAQHSQPGWAQHHWHLELGQNVSAVWQTAESEHPKRQHLLQHPCNLCMLACTCHAHILDCLCILCKYTCTCHAHICHCPCNLHIYACLCHAHIFDCLCNLCI